MKNIFSEAAALLKSGEDVVLAKIISDKGSTPRSSGAMMVIRRNGATIGTIGGGMVDAHAEKTAEDAFHQSLSIVSEVDMSSEDAAGADMICGGRIEFLCDYVYPDPQATDMFERSIAAERESRKHILCTEFEQGGTAIKAVRRFVIQNGRAVQELSESPDTLDKLWELGKITTGSRIVDVDGRTYCLDVRESGDTLFIFGAGHVGKEVATLAMNVGFRVVVCDDRQSFANETRFPEPCEIIVVDSFDDCLKKLTISESSYIIIVTRGHMHDKTVLEQALSTSAGYIGMIGSKRKREIIYNSLLSQGFSNQDLKRVDSPIGLPIDTDTPEEIAVSIVGQLVHLRSKKRTWRQHPSQQ
jgi:xanthine dehydrogenase accessory factor